MDAYHLALAYVSLSIFAAATADLQSAWIAILIANLWWIEGRRGRK